MATILPKPCDKSKLFVFEVLQGDHTGADYEAEHVQVTDTNGNVVGCAYPSKKFVAGTETRYFLHPEENLHKRVVNKFRRLDSDERAAQRRNRAVPATPTIPGMGVRGDVMDRADAQSSPHNPPVDKPDVAVTTPPQTPQRAKQPHTPPANLDTMSVNDLKAYAEDNEIDLKDAKNRADILRAIRTH